LRLVPLPSLSPICPNTTKVERAWDLVPYDAQPSEPDLSSDTEPPPDPEPFAPDGGGSRGDNRRRAKRGLHHRLARCAARGQREK